jgi:tetratricopeptide (TPR) repeat protein
MKNILLILFISISEIGFSQDIKQSFDFANELYGKQDYVGATITYRRVIYFDKAEEYRKSCYKNIADCLYETQQYEEAADYYELAFFQQKTDSSKAEVLFRKLSCYLIQNNFDYAQVELLNISEKLTEEQKRRKTFYSALLNFSTEKYEDSEKEFLQLIDTTNIESRKRVGELFVKNEKISKLSPRKARILSMIMPGLGQFYAGDFKNGANSILLTAGIGVWGVMAAVRSTSPIDALFTMVPWFQRYYSGGYKKAEIIAENQKKKRRAKVYNQILDEVSQ